MSHIQTLRPGLHCIDLDFGGQPGVIAAYLLEDGDHLALLEVGPTSTLPALLGGLEQLGVRPEAIQTLIVTHIHLDHAGAAGTLVRQYPHMHLFVHEVGAPHMIDPGKLLTSATRIYGDRMDSLWGAFEPVPAASLTPLSDGDVVQVGAIVLEALYTPGHASHHMAFHNRQSDEIFTGDVAAVRLQSYGYVRPPTPPPDIDLELWAASLQRLRDLRARRLLLTHFGAFDDVARHLDETERQIYAWGDLVERVQSEGYERDEIKDILQARAMDEVRAVSDDPAAVTRYELASPAGMSVDGYLRYLRKRAS